MPNPPKAVRPDRVGKAEMVADVIRHEVATGIYPPGSSLPTEAQLMQRFGLSRPSHREAFRILESEGLIKVARGPKGGAKVVVPDVRPVARQIGLYLQMTGAKLHQLIELRLAIEPAAVAAIAERQDRAALSELAQCVVAQKFSLSDRGLFNAQEAKFRALLLKHSSNEVLQLTGSFIEDIFDKHSTHLARRLPTLDYEEDHFRDGVLAKDRMIEQMTAGDVAGAVKSWRTYIKTDWERLAALIGAEAKIEVYAPDAPPPKP